MNEFGVALSEIVKDVMIGATVYGIVKARLQVAEYLKNRAQERQEIDAARELLGINKDIGISYRTDNVHILYPSKSDLHPDNLAPLAAICGNQYLRALKIGNFEATDSVSSSTNDNLILIGSPTSEGMSRSIFGYEMDMEDSLVMRDAPVDLPFRWQLSRSKIAERSTVRRYVPGKGWVSRPNWRIEGSRECIPETDYAGRISVDYLLVTRLRNYLTQEALDSGKFILSFGGTHGPATRAVELLLQDKEILRKIGIHLRNKPAAFQLLLRVADMRHHESYGTSASKIELVGDPIILPDNQAIWRSALSIAKRNLEKWKEN